MTKYTKELLEPIVRHSTTVADVIRRLGVLPSGGAHSHISKKIKEFGIDTSHFKDKVDFLKKSGRKKPPEEVLVVRFFGSRQKRVMLAQALIQVGVEYRCALCGITDTYNGEPVVLQVDHINRNWLDDRRENLRFLCPTCHSQRIGWSGSTRSIESRSIAGRPDKIADKRRAAIKDVRDKRRTCTPIPIKKCFVCGEDIKQKSKKFCSYACHHLFDRRVTRPTKAVLVEELKTTPVTLLGKKYGVSDNAVRKWARSYGIVLERRLGYWAKKKAGKI